LEIEPIIEGIDVFDAMVRGSSVAVALLKSEGLVDKRVLVIAG
jgi:hypothetical protein